MMEHIKQLNDKEYEWLLKFQVAHDTFMDKFIVNLNAHSCTCNFWQLVRISCRDVVAAITLKGENLRHMCIDTIGKISMSCVMDKL